MADLLDAVYADDEAVYRAFPGDYAPLAPPGFLAQGDDGAFAAGDRWTLTSDSDDFAALGLEAGMVVELNRDGNRPSHWARSGAHYVVDVAPEGGALALRCVGLRSGVGEPPGPEGGLQGVSYRVRSYRSPIEEASYRLNRLFGIDPAVPGRRPEDVGDLRALRMACVYMAVHRLLVAAVKTPGDVWAGRARDVEKLLESELDRLSVRWNDGESRQYFGTRVVRG